VALACIAQKSFGNSRPPVSIWAELETSAQPSLRADNKGKIETDIDCKICLINKARITEIAVPHHATKNGSFSI
jgi:hypothetical protein